jgi:adenine deaminase
MLVSGIIVDVRNRRTFKGTLHVEDGYITSVVENSSAPDIYILPGFIDAHIHIESSMVTPYEFARVAVGHGTVATVSDPHEIANVCGIEGVNFMLDNAREAYLKFYFGAPSCVPATTFENAGAVLNARDVDDLLARPEILYLSEMMNYPGVLHEDAEVMAKIASAKKYHKPIDGHAPGLRGEEAAKYISFGISTDHECFSLEEALDKIGKGMKVIIREGSAAKNFEALHPLIKLHPEMLMFCSDDKHPDDLLAGHINLLVRRAIQMGYDLMNVLHIACVHPVLHYGLDVGLLRVGDKADFILIEDLRDFKVLQTYIDGILVSDNGHCLIPPKKQPAINHFQTGKVTWQDLICYNDGSIVPVIGAIDGSLITEKVFEKPLEKNGSFVSDHERDILKICVKNRYNHEPPAVGFIKGFGFKNCAIASTVAHDSHNIIAVGDDDALLEKAINAVVESRGGLSAVSVDEQFVIPLPVAGLMSQLSVEVVANEYEKMNRFVKERGCALHAPFMTLSFMALLVIPKIKISDLGMFDAENFEFYL